MKQINLLLLVSGILVLCLVIGFIYFNGFSWVNIKGTSALALSDIAKLSVVEQKEAGGTSLIISGLNTNSSQCVSNFLTTTKSDTLIILLKTKLSNGKCSGSFNYVIPVSDTVQRVAIGSDTSIIWERATIKRTDAADEKPIIIDTLLKRQELLKTNDLPRIKLYLMNAVSTKAKAQLEASTDEQLEMLVAFMISVPLTKDMLSAQSNEWSFEDNIARVKIHTSASESITIEARKVDGVWY